MKRFLILILFTSFIITAQNNTNLSDGDFYYNKGLHYLKIKKDSSLYYFTKAATFYKSKNDSTNIASTLRKISNINYDFGFLIKAENQAFEALYIYEKLKKRKHQTYIYNLLGNVYKKNKNFADAINYHNKALRIRKSELKNNYLTLASLNNIALVYQESGNYFKAIEYLNSALKFDSLKIKKPIEYARLIDNKAYNLFLADSLKTQIFTLFNEALKIREAKNDIDGLTTSNLHLAEYYHKNKKIAKELTHLNSAYKFAKKNDDNFFLLVILKKLSIVNPKNSSAYFKEYQQVYNLIINEERKFKDISAKIEYQTEQKEKENIQLKAEKTEQTLQIEKEKTQKWLLGGGLGTSIITLFIFGYYYQKNKKQQLLIENLQKELHHRVKNNLGIIDTFIEVAKEEFSDKPFEHKLTELQHRIASINQVHKQLYSNKNLATLNVKKYVHELVTNIETSFAKQNIKIVQHIPEDLTISTTKSFPLGLIINEFLTNAFKYAFEDSEKGSIQITISSNKNSYFLTLQDSGKGLPTSFNLDKSTTFGIRIMKLLSEQLNGTFELNSNNGVQLTIKF